MKVLLFCSCIFSISCLPAQISKLNPDFRYADFHAHSTLKNYYRNISNPDTVIIGRNTKISKANVQQRNKSSVEVENFQKAHSSAIYGSINKSYNQTTFDKIKEGNGSFIFTSLYALEKQSLSEAKVSLVMPASTAIIFYTLTPLELALTPFTYLSKKTRTLRNTFWDYYVSRTIKIRNLNNLVVTRLPLSNQKNILNKKYSSFMQVNGEMKFLEMNVNKDIIIVRDSVHLDSLMQLRRAGIKIPALIFLTFEGGHNFYGNSNAAINDIRNPKCEDDTCKKEIFANIQTVKDGKYRVFMIGPAHLFYNKLGGGSRGLDIDRPKVFRKILKNSILKKDFSAIDFKPEEGLYIKIRERKDKPFTTIDEPISSIADTSRNFSVSNPCAIEYTGKYLSGENPGFGERILDSILDNHNKFKKRTYVDMRHLDVLARQQIIDYFDKNYWKKSDTVPLVVSHAAYSGENLAVAKATGLLPNFDSYAEFINYKKFLEQKIAEGCIDLSLFAADRDRNSALTKHLDSSGWFHPMSTNLYAEEITAIYKSKGMIGLTFEERALGATAYNYTINKNTRNNFTNYLSDANNNFNFSDEKVDSLISAEPFVRNLFAILKNSGVESNDINMWKHICIGTDFDGMINPIDICPTAKEIPLFYDFLCQNLDLYLAYLNQGINIKCGKSSIELMNMLFYENLENFTIKHF